MNKLASDESRVLGAIRYEHAIAVSRKTAILKRDVSSSSADCTSIARKMGIDGAIANCCNQSKEHHADERGIVLTLHRATIED